ncbi:MAG: PRC-barrel domain-containing protein [Gaiellaceae bacterium]
MEHILEAHTSDTIETNETHAEATAAATPRDNSDATETEPAVMHREIAEWHGRDLVDSHGERIGKLEEVYFDVETDQPQFGTVKEGFFGRHLTFVPLTGVTIGPDNLQVSVPKEQVENAPNIELQGGELSQPDESALYHHYQLNYTPPNTQSGRRLARR